MDDRTTPNAKMTDVKVKTKKKKKIPVKTKKKKQKNTRREEMNCI